MTAPRIVEPYLGMGGVIIPALNLPPEDAVTVAEEVQRQEDALLSGKLLGQVSSAGITAATLTVAAADPYLLADHDVAMALRRLVRVGDIVTVSESYSNPEQVTVWTNCEVISASVVRRRTLPGRTGARYSYAFTFRWRQA